MVVEIKDSRISSDRSVPPTMKSAAPMPAGGTMKKAAGLLLLSVGSLLVTGTLLHGCGSKEDAPAAGTPTPTGTGGTTAPVGTTIPATPKFTIVGAGK
jgi:hypothetical protein